MTGNTTIALDTVRGKLQEIRNFLDGYMYASRPEGEDIPEEDYKYCRKVYDAVCKAMDLL